MTPLRFWACAQALRAIQTREISIWLSQEPIFQKYLIDAGPLTRGLVSCTGSQFCGVAMIETKNRAMAIAAKLEQQLDIPATVRIHWTGCPNSCGQVCCRGVCCNELGDAPGREWMSTWGKRT